MVVCWEKCDNVVNKGSKNICCMSYLCFMLMFLRDTRYADYVQKRGR